MPAWDQKLTELKQQHAYRQRRLMQAPQSVMVTLDDNTYLNFSSNDYLGLANHADVRGAAKQAIDDYGCGSGASQLINGYFQIHAECEQRLAEFLQVEQVVLFGSGYLANAGVLSAFSKRHGLILADKLNHASLLDAAAGTQAQLQRYQHGDHQHAQRMLEEHHREANLIVTDGVFSMDGDIAPLPQLSALRTNYNSMLIVDDAHGIGVLGATGRGSLETLAMATDDVDILVGTFGKAFGSGGAFVAGQHALIDYLIQTARALIYTTAPAPALAAAACQSLQIITQQPERRARLHTNIDYFKHAIKSTGLSCLSSDSAIQGIILGSNEKALQFSQALEQRGILAVAVRPPTVPKNTARIRITLSSEHEFQQIDQLITALQDINHSYADHNDTK